ncbi:hypothetical protein ACFO3I_05005 [Rheinheimera marina]|uniref:Uncharacterized protein n=1 Tax=Rheinheimera marina TaxID=1774958 RepID=A0ABV9JJT8_9GAMM
MPWVNASATWPASALAIADSADGVLSNVESAMGEAVGRVESAGGKASYTKHDLSADAAGLLSLRNDLKDLLVTAKILTVTPATYGLSNQPGYLSTQEAVNALAAKLNDNADPHKPANQAHALVLLFSDQSQGQLLNQMTPIANLLALPSLLACQRSLQKLVALDTDKMQQPKAALTPRWKAKGQLNCQPLRTASNLMGAQIAQLESLAADAQTPAQKLSALADKRSAMLTQLQSDLTALQSVTGSVWKMTFEGSAAQLAVELQTTEPPVKAPFSAAVVVSSSQPLTFLQELLP